MQAALGLVQPSLQLKSSMTHSHHCRRHRHLHRSQYFRGEVLLPLCPESPALPNTSMCFAVRPLSSPALEGRDEPATVWLFSQKHLSGSLPSQAYSVFLSPAHSP